MEFYNNDYSSLTTMSAVNNGLLRISRGANNAGAEEAEETADAGDCIPGTSFSRLFVIQTLKECCDRISRCDDAIAITASDAASNDTSEATPPATTLVAERLAILAEMCVASAYVRRYLRHDAALNAALVHLARTLASFERPPSAARLRALGIDRLFDVLAGVVICSEGDDEASAVVGELETALFELCVEAASIFWVEESASVVERSFEILNALVPAPSSIGCTDDDEMQQQWQRETTTIRHNDEEKSRRERRRIHYVKRIYAKFTASDDGVAQSYCELVDFLLTNSLRPRLRYALWRLFASIFASIADIDGGDGGTQALYAVLRSHAAAAAEASILRSENASSDNNVDAVTENAEILVLCTKMCKASESENGRSQ